MRARPIYAAHSKYLAEREKAPKHSKKSEDQPGRTGGIGARPSTAAGLSAAPAEEAWGGVTERYDAREARALIRGWLASRARGYCSSVVLS